MHKTGGVLHEVSFPTFARTQKERARATAYFLKGTRVLSFFAFPAFLGLSSVAHETVSLLLGDKWRPAGPLLMILSLVMPLRMVSNLFPPALQGLGRADLSVSNLAVAMVAMPIAFLVGTRWGVIGVAVAWAAAFPAILAIMLYRSKAVLGITATQFIAAMGPAALASGLMYAGVLLMKNAIPADMPVVLRLAAFVTTGAAVYAAVVWLRYRDLCGEVLALVRR
jgi:O-antigen/teichoic acid export membrane protein